MTAARLQLTLFVAAPDAAAIEQVRATFDPVQHDLIAAHVTLCREDELLDLERVRRNLAALASPPLEFDVGPAVRFADGAGVLLPAVGAPTAFDALRRRALAGVVDQPRHHDPHVTLLHPRNATCTDAIFAAIATHALPRRLRFEAITLIEQRDGGRWRALATWPLTPA